MFIERVVLGLDISSSITGLALVDPDTGELLHYDHIDLRKAKCVFDKAEIVRKHLQVLKTSANIRYIYIEQPFTFFNSGGSTAKTMATLQKFNGIVSWICYDLWEIKPNYIGALQARKAYGIKVPRGQKAKPVVLEHVLKAEKTFSIQMTRHGNPKPESYDRADAIVIARAGSIMEKQNETDTK
jgi:Holliday junction resolvasome RuvABC endonuclease subunit